MKSQKYVFRYYLNLVLVDEEERRYFKQQEITLWRKGERVRSLPLGNALYQQQHALARHAAGDQPTQGVRTAPTPSQPPTPYTETEKPLPGDQEAAEVEEVTEDDRVTEQQTETNDDDDNLAAETEEKCVISSESTPPPVSNVNPPDLVSHVPPALPASSPEGDSNPGETDSLADLDIVAVGSGDVREPPEDMNVPDNLDSLDSPPEMPDTPEDSPSSPVISLPDAPSSEPGSPDLKVQNFPK